MRLVPSSSYGSASSMRISSAVGLRTASMRPSIAISSLSFFRVASAHTSRHAAFGMIVAIDECASCLAPRTRSSKYAMPFRPRDTVGRPAASLSRLPRCTVGAQAVRVLPHEFGEVLGADLLLALIEDANAQRQLADGRAVRLDRL